MTCARSGPRRLHTLLYECVLSASQQAHVWAAGAHVGAQGSALQTRTAHDGASTAPSRSCARAARPQWSSSGGAPACTFPYPQSASRTPAGRHPAPPRALPRSCRCAPPAGSLPCERRLPWCQGAVQMRTSKQSRTEPDSSRCQVTTAQVGLLLKKHSAPTACDMPWVPRQKRSFISLPGRGCLLGACLCHRPATQNRAGETWAMVDTGSTGRGSFCY